jgi:hypothetical protein
LADKAGSLATVEEQLQQERSVRQQVETQLQQERSVLEEALATLGRECLAREEAQGQLQRERAAQEAAQATLKLLDQEITRLSGVLVQEGVFYEELWQASEEKDAIILKLQQATDNACSSLELEKKQVEVESPFLSFACWLGSFGIHSQLYLCLCSQAFGRLSKLSDPGAGHPDSLQLFPAGAGGAAGRRP